MAAVARDVHRIGVVADSHVGEFMDALPEEVFSTLAGCELILHAGDICRPWVLDELRRIAPVVAVRGDHDQLGALPVPRSRVIEVGGARIGLIHGRRWYPLEMVVVTANVLARRHLRWRGGFHGWLLRQFRNVDCVVYGHWHEPDLTQSGTTLLFSPGAVCPWGSLHDGRTTRPGVRGIADRFVRRYRTQLGPEATRPSVGIIEVTDGTLTARTVPLKM